MKSRVKNTLIVIILVAVSGTLLIIARSYVFHNIKKTIERKLEALNKKDFHIQYDSIYIDWKKNLITIDKLVIQKDAYDTSCVYPEFISANKVRIEGFGLLKFILKKQLNFKSVQITKPHIVVREHSRLLLDSASQKENEFVLNIERVNIDSAHIEYTDSSSCNLIAEFKSNVEAGTLSVDFHSDRPFVLNMKVFNMDSTKINLPKSFYAFKIKSTKIDFRKGTLALDSIKIIPQYTKLDFGRKKGHDTDRIEGSVPFINFSGFSIQYPDSFLVKVRKMDVQAFLKIFHDKRLPHEKKYKPLPVEAVRKLAFGLQIDTIEISKSYIEYEEWGKEAKSPGAIFFDDLKGFIYSVNNDSKLTDGHTTMKATGAFMGQGIVEVTTILPWNPKSNYKTEGSVRNFPMQKINPMMEPAAKMKVESGMLDNMKFDFAYNNIRSDGEIKLNYHDLKLVTFKSDIKAKQGEAKNKEEDRKRDNLKTFIINTFVIKKNMDGNTPEEKKTGTILFYRDETRSIFNYWWKSALSGIKSAYNIDKMEKAKAKKESKKEERKDRRAQRKEERRNKKHKG